MFKTIAEFVKENKTEIIKVGVIVAGAVAGLVISGVISNAMSDNEVIEAEAPSAIEQLR